jgi:hypothetical protein
MQNKQGLGNAKEISYVKSTSFRSNNSQPFLVNGQSKIIIVEDPYADVENDAACCAWCCCIDMLCNCLF